MPKVSGQGHSLAGHGCFIPHAIAGGSDWVDADGTPVAHKGDASTPHPCPTVPLPPHSGSLAGTHFADIDGMSIQVMGDPVTCGSSISGSFDFIDLED